MIQFRKLAEAGVHFGHETSRWCPKMAPYIWGSRNKVHLIDVSKTAAQLEKAAQFLEEVGRSGKQILWVGTKKSAQDVVAATAISLKMPFVNHRWIGGTLSNYTQVKKSITKLLHYEDIIANAEKFTFYTKKDINIFQKIIDRLLKSIGGIRTISWPIGAIVLVDVSKERSALKEAAAMGIPVVAIVDTNGDPSLVDYVIPGNDDTPRSIKVIMDYLGEAVARAKAKAEVKNNEVSADELLAAEREERQKEVLRLASQEDDDEEARKKAKKQGGPAAKVKVKTLEEIEGTNEVAEAEKQKGRKPLSVKDKE